MVARRELQFTPGLLRPKQVMPDIGAELEAASSGGKVLRASGIPSPRKTDRVVDFSDRVSDSVIQKQRQQRARRFKSKGIEALGVIAVSTAFSAITVIALARLIPYQTAQRERLDEINSEVQTVEHRVETLRRRFPEIFASGKSRDALVRQHGFVKPNQIPIKILDSNSPRPKPNN